MRLIDGDALKDKLELLWNIHDEMDFANKDVWRAIENAPVVEPERKIIQCADCKWWDRLEENHPYGYCLACKSGTRTNRWDISIRRLCKYDFFCADAEPKEDEDGDE